MAANLHTLQADVVVLGAGAAGLMAAIEAGRRARRVLLLDHGDRPGRKILISGGGRCNFTNLGTRAENFVSENVHFARSALARYTPADFLALVEKHGIRWHEKTLGQLFCNDSAKRIVTMLEHECGEAGVTLQCGVRILTITQQTDNTPTRFSVETTIGRIDCASLIVATGGLSIPKLGATGFGYDLARQFGHTLVEPRAALVPLVLSPNDAANWCDLSGVSTEVIASAAPSNNQKARTRPATDFREKLLITHRGLSGPAVLQISSYWRPGSPLTFDLAPNQTILAPLFEKHARRDPAALLSALRTILPARLAERWATLQLQQSQDWTNTGLNRLEQALHAWTLHPAGTEGYAKAEVTAGGINTHELDARTLQSRRIPGLFFIGEVVDVTGWLGGYNFQWAWASGVAAGAIA